MGILLRGGVIVIRDFIGEADILVEDGKIVRLGKNIESGYSKVVDVRGRLLLPGAIDAHVHGREPGLEYKDDFTHTSMAAALGGVTTVFDMPNTVPPVDSPARLAEKRALLSSKSYVDFGLYAVLYDYHDDVESRVVELVRAGAIGFKAFLGQTVGGIPPPSFGTVYKAMELSRKLGFVIAFHAEDRGCVDFFTDSVLREGRTGLKAYSDARPPICEKLSIDFVLSIASMTGGRAYIAHLTTATALNEIARFRRSFPGIFVETTPTYLFFDYEHHENLGTLLKVNPPIRSYKNRKKLWDALSRGIIDVVATDHAPHAPHEKATDFWKAAPGVASIQHLLPLMVSSALEGYISLNKVVELCSENPAKIFGLYPVKGTLLPGADADIVVIDPTSEYVVTEDSLAYKHRLSPYVGWRIRGRIDKVFLRGELVVDEGVLVASRPVGRPIR